MLYLFKHIPRKNGKILLIKKSFKVLLFLTKIQLSLKLEKIKNG